jgi:pilus assembly protein CpaF
MKLFGRKGITTPVNKKPDTAEATPSEKANFVPVVNGVLKVHAEEPTAEVEKFRTDVHANLIRRIDLETAVRLSPAELLLQVESFVLEYANEYRSLLNEREQRQIAEEIVNDMVGLGPLEPLLRDEAISDIMVNGPAQVYVERQGKLLLTNIKFRDQAHLIQVAQRIAVQVGRRVDESSPMVDARLKDGSRVNIVLPPVALDGASISIRKFAKVSISFRKMVNNNTLDLRAARLLEIASVCRLNILISGGTGSGKTTLLNALSSMIDPGERIVTVEDAAELKLQQPHVVRLESRPANIEGEGQITIRDLVRNALRMRPERIIIGEVRGPECLDMLQAMNTGHDGSMATVHANSASEALGRLENLVAMSGVSLPGPVVRQQITTAINLIVQTERMRDGVRRITEIVELAGVDPGGTFITHKLFWYVYESEDADGNLIGHFERTDKAPHFLNRAKYYGLDKELLTILGQAVPL